MLDDPAFDRQTALQSHLAALRTGAPGWTPLI